MSDFVNTSTELGSNAALSKLVAGALKEFKDDTILVLGTLILWGHPGLQKLYLPSIKSLGVQSLSYLKDTTEVWIGRDGDKNALTIGRSTFSGSSKLQHLIINKGILVPLGFTDTFSGTRIGRKRGVVYVPASMVNTYKAATNWSLYLIHPISDYPWTDYSTITDTWEQIFAAEANGTYKTKYKIGDTKKLLVGGIAVYMQIVAFDADTLGSGATGKAPITWIAQDVYTARRINTAYAITNGWAKGSDGIYVSKNKGRQSTTATAKWTIVFPTGGLASTSDVIYKVSSEQNYDKLTVKVDGTTIANGISGAGSWITYSFSNTEGSHTLEASYSKDGSQDKNDDCAYININCPLATVTLTSTNTEASGGGYDGWASSELRTWLRSTLLNNIPTVVKNNIKVVSKTYKDVKSGTTKSCDDNLWIPSYREIFGTTNSESSGPIYSSIFTSFSARQKYDDDGTRRDYWLRSAYDNERFYACNGNATYGISTLGSYAYVAFGFCT